eukprot:CAMPEP_0170597724 /NCGR_PEP_ID=MMETSP0224-20130122/15858_1 /TAXON_ID=285029 /ORGANISM="Togula jolla, Strain CCCM 725" /LENGTH=409 /DNA_ID=CAMNT_0010922211 /DNA_START=20 /DNA_END=1249 /DNA_ORIENTATION=+
MSHFSHASSNYHLMDHPSTATWLLFFISAAASAAVATPSEACGTQLRSSLNCHAGHLYEADVARLQEVSSPGLFLLQSNAHKLGARPFRTRTRHASARHRSHHSHLVETSSASGDDLNKPVSDWSAVNQSLAKVAEIIDHVNKSMAGYLQKNQNLATNFEKSLSGLQKDAQGMELMFGAPVVQSIVLLIESLKGQLIPMHEHFDAFFRDIQGTFALIAVQVDSEREWVYKAYADAARMVEDLSLKNQKEVVPPKLGFIQDWFEWFKRALGLNPSPCIRALKAIRFANTAAEDASLMLSRLNVTLWSNILQGVVLVTNSTRLQSKQHFDQSLLIAEGQDMPATVIEAIAASGDEVFAEMGWLQADVKKQAAKIAEMVIWAQKRATLLYAVTDRLVDRAASYGCPHTRVIA